MAQFNSVYQRAFYYDIALKRDVSREVVFMLALYRHHTGREMRSMLDIACGPGYHARTFATRQVRAFGLDLRPEMVEFARDQAAVEGVEVNWLAADMRTFRLETPVDMAICIFDGLDALLTNEEIIQHFRTVAANLSAGGLYLLEHTHPRYSSLQNYGAFRYEGKRDGVAVAINWATNNPTFHPVTGIAHVDIDMQITENGHAQTIHDTAQERLLSPQEIFLLAERSEALQVVDWYGEFDLNQPLDNSPGSQRMITVLQKMSGGGDDRTP
jgi:SAM-dependent methyltransferase